MLRTSSLWLLAVTVAGLGGLAQGSEAAPDDRTAEAPDGSFSITFPDSWRAVPTREGDYVQLALFAEGPLDISIVVGARPLDETERALDRRRLLDRMIELTMINSATLGNEIVHVGRIDPLIEDWPAFAAVATNADRSKMLTTSRSFDAERAYVVTTLTDNQQGSADLGAIVQRVVSSLSVHPPAPAQPPSGDGGRP